MGARPANSQVLISLIFGDALNTPKMEFGLVGGDNLSFMLGYPDAKPLNNFNIGFYFHIMLKEQTFISTGVLVKSNVGATGMPVYPSGDNNFDSLFVGGTLTKKINYFYVPIMIQQRFNDNRWYVEAGLQPGLRYKAKDIFDTKVLGGDLEYEVDVRDTYKHLDIGFIGGIGYKLKKQLKSAAVGVNYYYGFVNVSAEPDVSFHNSSIYFYVKLPIGTKHDDEEAAAKEKSKKK